MTARNDAQCRKRRLVAARPDRRSRPVQSATSAESLADGTGVVYQFSGMDRLERKTHTPTRSEIRLIQRLPACRRSPPPTALVLNLRAGSSPGGPGRIDSAASCWAPCLSAWPPAVVVAEVVAMAVVSSPWHRRRRRRRRRPCLHRMFPRHQQAQAPLTQ